MLTASPSATGLAAITPWTVAECARIIAVTPNFIRGAIVRGVRKGTATIRLEAEVIEIGGRRHYRIHRDRFDDFLSILGWQRLPTRQDPPPVTRRARSTREAISVVASL